jgi:phospholipase C
MQTDNPGNRPEDAVPGTDYRSPAPFKAAVGRRRFLQVGGALAGAAAVGTGVSQLGGLTGRNQAAAAVGRGRTGSMADLKHVVILMQENRSFDHYYGTLRGVRGFSDKQVLKYQNGTTIFNQPDKSRTDLGCLLPFHMDSKKVDAQNAGDLDHSWVGDHSARNNGLWNNWVPAKTEQTMGYFTRATTRSPTRSPSVTATTSRSSGRPARTGCTSGRPRRLAGRPTRTTTPSS